MTQRLQKLIAQQSEYSRRKAEELIEDGRVSVNGIVTTQMGLKYESDVLIEIDGQKLYDVEKVYYLLNKPVRYISSRTDTHERDTVIDLIDTDIKIYPVGRLDYNTSGLLVLTNDGTLANLLMHPRYHINKTYIANIRGFYDEEDLDTLREGIFLDEIKTAPAIIEEISFDEDNADGKLKVKISQGMNRQVRRMFDYINCRVYKLQRVEYSIFDLSMENLKPGEYREITPSEIESLYAQANSSPDNNKKRDA